MQPLGALLLPGQRGLERVAELAAGAGHALDQLDGPPAATSTAGSSSRRAVGHGSRSGAGAERRAGASAVGDGARSTGHSDAHPVRAAAAAPASPDFSGWNWVAAQRAVLDGGDEAARRASAQVTTGATAANGAARASSVQLLRGVRVDEVEPLVARRRRTAASRAGRRPSTSPCAARPRPAAARPCPATRRAPRSVTALGSVEPSNSTCIPTQTPEHRPPAGQPQVDEPGPVGRAQAAHARVEVADAGHEQAVGGQRRLAGRRSARRRRRRAPARAPPSGRCRCRSRGPRRRRSPRPPSSSAVSDRWVASSATSRSNGDGAAHRRLDVARPAARRRARAGRARAGRAAPSTVTSRSSGAPCRERSTSASASSRTRPCAPAAASSIGSAAAAAVGVATTPRRGSHTSQWMAARQPGRAAR